MAHMVLEESLLLPQDQVSFHFLPGSQKDQKQGHASAEKGVLLGCDQ